MKFATEISIVMQRTNHHGVGELFEHTLTKITLSEETKKCKGTQFARAVATEVHDRLLALSKEDQSSYDRAYYIDEGVVYMVTLSNPKAVSISGHIAKIVKRMTKYTEMEFKATEEVTA